MIKEVTCVTSCTQEAYKSFWNTLHLEIWSSLLLSCDVIIISNSQQSSCPQTFLKKTWLHLIFQLPLLVFGNVMKHKCEHLIQLLKQIRTSGENQGESLANFASVGSHFQNLSHLWFLSFVLRTGHTMQHCMQYCTQCCTQCCIVCPVL